MSANFTPNLNPINTLPPFKWFVQTALPLVYDDSLSYYEVLTKLTHYINKCIGDIKVMIDNDGKIVDSFVDLQNYVNDYFENLNINNNIQEVIREMIADGSIDTFASQPALNSDSTNNITELPDGYRNYSFTSSRKVTGLPNDFPELSSGTIVSMNGRHIIFGGKSVNISATTFNIVPFIYFYQPSAHTWYLIYNSESILKSQAALTETTQLSTLDAGMYFIQSDAVLDSVPPTFDENEVAFLTVLTFSAVDMPYYYTNKIYYLTQSNGDFWIKYGSDNWIDFNDIVVNIIKRERNGLFVNHGMPETTAEFYGMQDGYWYIPANMSFTYQALPARYNSELSGNLVIITPCLSASLSNKIQFLFQENGEKFVRFNTDDWISFTEQNKTAAKSVIDLPANGYFINRGSILGDTDFDNLATGYYGIEAHTTFPSTLTLPPDYDNNYNAIVEIQRVDTGSGAETVYQFIRQSNGAEYFRIETQRWHKFTDLKTPESYGAVGDGIADDTEPLQRAINNSRTLILDKVYKITSGLTINGGNAYILGINRARIINNSSDYAITITSNYVTLNSFIIESANAIQVSGFNCFITNMTCNGDKTDTTDGTGYGIMIKSAESRINFTKVSGFFIGMSVQSADAFIEDVYLENNSSYGFQSSNGSIVAKHIHSYNNAKYGMSISGGSTFSAFYDCYVDTCKNMGISVRDINGPIMFVNCWVYRHNGTYAWQISNVSDITLYNCYTSSTQSATADMAIYHSTLFAISCFCSTVRNTESYISGYNNSQALEEYNVKSPEYYKTETIEKGRIIHNSQYSVINSFIKEIPVIRENNTIPSESNPVNFIKTSEMMFKVYSNNPADDAWENGSINATTGEDYSDNNILRTPKENIIETPNDTFIFALQYSHVDDFRAIDCFCYDSNKLYLGHYKVNGYYTNIGGRVNVYQLPLITGTKYIRFTIVPLSTNIKSYRIMVSDTLNVSGYSAPYISYNISLNSYGGYFDIISGIYYDLYEYIPVYNGETITGEYYSSTGTLTTGCQVLKKLDTPVTRQLEIIPLNEFISSSNMTIKGQKNIYINNT